MPTAHPGTVQLDGHAASGRAATRPDLVNNDASFGELAGNWGNGHASDGASWPRRPGSSARASVSGGSQGSRDLGAMVVCMPDRDLGQALDPGITGLQIRGGAAGHQRTDGRTAAAQVLSSLGPGHRHRRGSVPGIEGVDDIGVHRHHLAPEDLAHPAGQVLIRIRNVICHHAHRPWVALERRGIPLLGGA